MEKSIVEKMMARILSHPYQAMNGLVRLICVKKQEEKYTIKNLEERFPFLREEDLETKHLNEILDELEEQIIKKINLLAQDEANKCLYELTALVIALDTIIDNDHEPDGLIRNDRVELCYDLGMLIIDCDAIEVTEFWLNENLKKLNFN